MMTTLSKPIRIAFVDDDRLFTQLLSAWLGTNQEVEIVITAQGGDEFLKRVGELSLPLDVLVTDLRMQKGNGIELLEHVNSPAFPFPHLKKVVLSSHYRRSFMGQMLKLGANAFLPKEIDQHEFLQILKTVHQAGHYFSSEQVETMRQQISPKIPRFHLPQKDQLTVREIEVLQLLCQQHSTRGIADRLCLGIKAVEYHKSNLFSKTGTRNIAGLVIYAIQNRIVDAEEVVLLEG